MAKYGPNQLKAKARELKEPLEILIPRVVREEGSISGAARRLDVSAGSIRYWLRKFNYVTEVRHIVTLEQEVAQS